MHLLHLQRPVSALHQRLPCQRELAPEATEGFTAGTFRKYKPMWKPASLRNPPASASRGTPLSQGGLWSVHPKGSLVKGSWHGVAVTEGFYRRHLSFLKIQCGKVF